MQLWILRFWVSDWKTGLSLIGVFSFLCDSIHERAAIGFKIHRVQRAQLTVRTTGRFVCGRRSLNQPKSDLRLIFLLMALIIVNIGRLGPCHSRRSCPGPKRSRQARPPYRPVPSRGLQPVRSKTPRNPTVHDRDPGTHLTQEVVIRQGPLRLWSEVIIAVPGQVRSLTQLVFSFFL